MVERYVRISTADSQNSYLAQLLALSEDRIFLSQYPKQKISEKNDSENSLIDKLGTIPVSESVLTELVQKTISEIKSELVVLELQGLIRKVDGGYVRV